MSSPLSNNPMDVSRPKCSNVVDTNRLGGTPCEYPFQNETMEPHWFSVKTCRSGKPLSHQFTHNIIRTTWWMWRTLRSSDENVIEFRFMMIFMGIKLIYDHLEKYNYDLNENLIYLISVPNCKRKIVVKIHRVNIFCV